MNPLQKESLENLNTLSFTSALHDKATLDDLNFEYMKEYLLRSEADDEVMELSKFDMAKFMGLISEGDDGVLRVKNFAILMFADYPKQLIPNAYIEVNNFATNKKEKRDIFAGPLWIQVKEAISEFNTLILDTHLIRTSDDINHKILHSYPPTAFSELLIDAILNHDYGSKKPITVDAFPYHLSITNYNKILSSQINLANNKQSLNKKTTQKRIKEIKELLNNYKQNNGCLNKELKDMFIALNYIEANSSALEEAAKALLENGSPQFEYKVEKNLKNSIKTILPMHEDFLQYVRVGSYVEKKEDETIKTFRHKTTNKVLKVNKAKEPKNNSIKFNARQEQIIYLLEENPKLTALELAKEINEITADGVRYHLKNLKAQGILKREGSTKAGIWLVARS